MSITAVSHTTVALPECLDQLQNSQFQNIRKSSALPERQMVDFLAGQQQQFSAHLAVVNLEAANQAPQTVTDPQKMLAIQHGIMQAMLTVDIAAKFVGGMTQAVNRLVTIQ